MLASQVAIALARAGRAPIPDDAQIEEASHEVAHELRLALHLPDGLSVVTAFASTAAVGGVASAALRGTQAPWQRPFAPPPEVRHATGEVLEAHWRASGVYPTEVELHVRTEELIFVRYLTEDEEVERWFASRGPRLVRERRLARSRLRRLFDAVSRPGG